jgi:hypothetical protein
MAEHPPQPPIKPAPEVEATAPVRTTADDWKSRAERFARGHLGRFIDGEPLIEGLAEIPLDILPPAPATATWFLGNGRIYLDNGTYPFGDGFEKELPEVRYEIPALAADLHLKSAFVELHPRGDVLQLVVGGVPADLPGASEAEKKARTADLKRRIEMLTPRLRAYRRPNTPDDQKDKAFQAIIELAQIKFPPVPPRPNPGDPKYKNRPDLYNADVQAYRNASAQNEAVRAAVPETGTRRLREYQQTLDSLQKESRPAVSQARRESDPALMALKQRCRSISALIYQPVLRSGESVPAGDKPSNPAEKAVGPAVPASPPPTLKLHWNGGTTMTGGPAVPARPPATAENPSAEPPSTPPPETAGPETAPPAAPPHHDPTAASLPAIDGAFHFEKRPITGLRAPVMAKVRFAVTAEGGKKLPPNVRQSAVIGSLLIEKNKEGMIRLIETPEIQVQETGAPMVNLIYQDAVSLRPQIRFFRRPADRFQSKLELAAVSTGQPIEPVEQDREYVVRFEIGAAGLDKLMHLLEGQ